MWLVPIVALGAFFRLYLLQGQVLLDDEWHGLHYVIGRSYAFLLTHFAVPGATSIPTNLYTRFLLDTTGWSELLLRLPSIAAGLAGLVVLPLLVRRLFGTRAAIAFGVLLALSPFLIFYSRVARPYTAVTLFGAVSMFSGWLWMSTGKRSHAIAWLIAGVLAVWFHMFAAVAVFVPLLTALAFSVTGKARDAVKVRPAGFAAPILVSALLCALLVLPAMLDSMKGTMAGMAGQDRMNWKSLTGFLTMLCGSANPLAVIAFMVLAAAGLMRLLFSKPVIGAGIGLTVIAYLILFAITGPHSIHAPIVISRYAVPIFPTAFILVAVGIELVSVALVRNQKPARDAVCAAILILLAAGLYATGPLIWIYAGPNNFTNHSAFQQSYSPPARTHSYVSQMIPPVAPFRAEELTVSAGSVPDFYRQLGMSPLPTTVVEYPMLIGDHFNPLYYYQQFHHHPVLIGYVPGLGSSAEQGFVFGDSIPDAILGRIGNRNLLKFRNMVDMTDIEALRKRASLVVLHKNPLGELSAWMGEVAGAHPVVASLRKEYDKILGPSVFEDEHIVVYRLAGM